MDARTRTALEASIQHWADNVNAEWPDRASTDGDDCALCDAFYDDNCEGCPVSAATGEANCRDTPYGDALVSLNWWRSHPSRDEATAEWRKAARAELDFLKSLLPED